MQTQCPDWTIGSPKAGAMLGALTLALAGPAAAQEDGEASRPTLLLTGEPDAPPPSPYRSPGPPTIWTVDILCGLSFGPGVWGLSADLGLRVDKVRARYHGSVTLKSDSDFTSSGLRADWIFAEDLDAGVAGFVGGGGGTLKQTDTGAPARHGAVLALEAGMVVGSSWRLTPLVVGIELLVPVSGVPDSRPMVALTLSFDPLYWVLDRLHNR